MFEAFLVALGVFVVGFFLGMFVHEQKESDPNSWEVVEQFHKKFEHPAPAAPRLIDPKRAALRLELIREELDEYRMALASNDIVGIADALGDLDYVVNGAAVEHGIYLPDITQEIHRSNMTKLGEDGKPIYREDGKILKGENYEPPRIAPFVGK